MSLRYTLRRLLQVLPAVAAIVLLGFILVQAAPGDPVLALAGEDGDAAYYEATRARFGLNDPWLVQLGRYTANVLRGDLGTSYVHGREVMAVIGERVPATLLLVGTSLVLSVVGGVVLGVVAARRPDRGITLGIDVTTLTLFAAPAFWLGQLALLGFALKLGWFPVQGMTDARSSPTGFAAVVDVAHHLALPALVLTAHQLAVIVRLSRSGLREELRSAHVRTARAKGLTERRVVWVHGLRRALLPIATVVGGRLGHLLTGTVVIEAVFGWPGLGRLLLTSVESRDQPVLLGIFLLVSLSVVLANLLTDLVYGVIDPRIRFR